MNVHIVSASSTNGITTAKSSPRATFMVKNPNNMTKGNKYGIVVKA